MLDRSFSAAAPDRRWIANFTYLWILDGWLYVAAVIDLFSRRVMGWSMSARMTAELVTDELIMASQVTCDLYQRAINCWALCASVNFEVFAKTDLSNVFASARFPAASRARAKW